MSNQPIENNDMPEEIDFSKGVRGLHHISPGDRKSTRLNSSHRCSSYAGFCLKKQVRRRHEDPRLHRCPPDRCHPQSPPALRFMGPISPPPPTTTAPTTSRALPCFFLMAGRPRPFSFFPSPALSR